jgi:hypothetical protein
LNLINGPRQHVFQKADHLAGGQILALEQAVDGLGKTSNVGGTRNQLFSPYNLPRRRNLQSAEKIRPSEKNQLGWKK